SGTYRGSTTASEDSTFAGENRHAKSKSVSNSSGSGSATYQSTSSNEHTQTSGSFDVVLQGSQLTASQVYGTREVPDGEGNTTTVPFRGNSVTSAALDVDSAGVYSASSSHIGNFYSSDSQSTGATTRRENSSGYTSSYTGIAGEYEGYSLSKSHDTGSSSTSIFYTNDNGNTERYGTYSENSQGSSDSITVLSSDKTYASGDNTISTSYSSTANAGADSTKSSQGVFSEDSNGRSQTGTSFVVGSGYSSSTASQSRTVSSDDFFSYSTSTNSAKGQTNTTGQGIAKYENDSLELLRAKSSTSSSSRADTSGNYFEKSYQEYGSTISFSMQGSSGNTRGSSNNSGSEVNLQTGNGPGQISSRR
ncbi:MAG: hypothetical protein KDA51_18210, partial [Planctomycetales bacterium]|nr:hypothetical protein [Planctomycetales bacterium]